MTGEQIEGPHKRLYTQTPTFCKDVFCASRPKTCSFLLKSPLICLGLKDFHTNALIQENIIMILISLSLGDPLEKEMATHVSIIA